MFPCRPTVLCVENRRGLLDEISHLLADAGYDVVGTTSSEWALQMVHSRPVDGILIDLFLREPTAAGLRDQIRQSLPDVPILLFHGEGTLLTLQLQVLEAWMTRAQREA